MFGLTFRSIVYTQEWVPRGRHPDRPAVELMVTETVPLGLVMFGTVPAETHSSLVKAHPEVTLMVSFEFGLNHDPLPRLSRQGPPSSEPHPPHPAISATIEQTMSVLMFVFLTMPRPYLPTRS